ncbi:MAG TPA: class I SAM-dependent methyltransferase, partial [Anaerolinea sp.]|nr:class I SAM-dependent methyltransferase [Anaerolinea sp.]
YDRFVNWPARLGFEMPFLEKQLGGPGRAPRVLDAACGTGRHAIQLARRGYRAAGADLSAGMIQRAQRNAAEAEVSVDFRAVGFGGLAQAFAGQAPFDALLCLGNSLPHVVMPEALAATLVDFAACLRPGGLLLVQNRNFDAVMERRERWMEPQAHREDGAEWLFVRFYDYLPDGLINFNILTLRRAEGEGWQQQVSSTQLAPQPFAGLAAALEAAGFEELEAFGGMDGSPFDAQSSGNLVLRAQRRG